MRGWVLLVGLIFCYVRPAVPHLCGCICGLVLVLHLHGPFWTFPTWMCVCVCVCVKADPLAVVHRAVRVLEAAVALALAVHPLAVKPPGL